MTLFCICILNDSEDPETDRWKERNAKFRLNMAKNLWKVKLPVNIRCIDNDIEGLSIHCQNGNNSRNQLQPFIPWRWCSLEVYYA